MGDPNSAIDRRTLLRLGGAGALSLAAASAIAACGGGNSGSKATAPSTGPSTTAFRPAAFDPSTPWWLQGGFAPVTSEVEAVDLPVEGQLPAALAGLYVRNGSNPKPGWAPHWFLGDGMVHGVLLADGKASWYRNRYVDTTLLAAGGGLTAKGAPGDASSLSNVSLVHHAGKLLSLGEIGWPYELNPNDLSTVGPYDFAGKLHGNMTAHPKIDPATGMMHFFGYNFAEPYLVYHVADRDGKLVSSEPVAVKASTMMHDFAITDRDVIFWEMPVLFDMDLAIKMVSEERSTVMPYVWKESYGARVGVMPLGGPTSKIRWTEIEPCYVFHGMNAWRDGNTIRVDVCRLPKVFDGNGMLPASRLHRWTIVDDEQIGVTLTDERRSDTTADLPTIDKRYTGIPYQHGWRAEVRKNPKTVDMAGVVHTDAQSGAETRWDPGAKYSSGEWLFVPTGDGEAEGVLMSFVYNKADATSQLVVLDARDIGAGPLAKVTVPQRVPYGFHATWVPTTEA